MEIIKPLQPTPLAMPVWRFDGWTNTGLGMAMVWMHRTRELVVLSAVEKAEPDPGELDVGAEYHVSVSRGGGRRCTSNDAREVLRMFSADDATEDNHVPNGKVRNFWMPVAEKYRGYECPCVEHEPAMLEDRGDYLWRPAPNHS